MIDYEVLKLIWWALVGVLLIGFAVLGGMDLAVGFLLPILGRTDNERRILLNSVGPTWEGNQVWFITAGGAMFAAWPVAYATAFSGLYYALMLVLFAMILRPPGFDYRSKVKDTTWRGAWDWALFVSGFVPCLLFGVAFGNLFLGLPFEFDDTMRVHFAGNFFELLHPFALLSGVVCLSMLSFQAAIYILLKTDGQALAARARQAVRITGVLFALSFAVCGWWVARLPGFEIISMPDAGTLLSPLHKVAAQVPGAWTGSFVRYPVLWAFPGVVFAGIFAGLFFAMMQRYCVALICSSLAVSATVATAGVSLFPFIFPSRLNPSHGLTLWDAASSHGTLQWMLLAVIIFFPIILFYTAWVFKVMRGKIDDKTLDEPNRY